jgi:hypothetical protein
MLKAFRDTSAELWVLHDQVGGSPSLIWAPRKRRKAAVRVRLTSLSFVRLCQPLCVGGEGAELAGSQLQESRGTPFGRVKVQPVPRGNKAQSIASRLLFLIVFTHKVFRHRYDVERVWPSAAARS